jgi:hypothetical protein
MTFPVTREQMQAIRETHVAEYESVQVDVDVNAVIEYMSAKLLKKAKTSYTLQYQFWAKRLQSLPGRPMTKSVQPFMKQIRAELKRRFPGVTFDMDRECIYITVTWDYE